MRPIAASAQIAASCPAGIFRAHGQASMIHYLALGRTILTNTRDRGAGVGGVVRVPCPGCHVVHDADHHRRHSGVNRSRHSQAAVLDVTISLTGSAGLRPAWLASVTAAVTRTVQLAQVTTMPALWLPLVFSGLLFPLAMLPGPLRWVAEALPLTPVVELMRLALTGTAAAGGHRLGLAATFSAAVIPVLVLTAWIAVAGWAARRWFRWEPRR